VAIDQVLVLVKGGETFRGLWRVLRHLSRKNVFWKEINKEYGLFEFLCRIRVSLELCHENKCLLPVTARSNRLNYNYSKLSSAFIQEIQEIQIHLIALTVSFGEYSVLHYVR
jgi:hypothetical protein